MMDQHQIDELLNKARQAGASPVEQLMKNLKPEDAKRLNAVLADEQATRQLLSTPQAQALLKKIVESQNGQSGK